MLYSVAMSAKSEDDMRGLRVINVLNRKAPRNFEDLWGFNFMRYFNFSTFLNVIFIKCRLLSNGIITSGLNVRVNLEGYPIKFKNYGFDAEVNS